MSRYCNNIEAYIVDYFEGHISENDRKRLLAHIEICGDCKKKFEDYERACVLLQNLKYARYNVPDMDTSALFLTLREQKRRLKLRLQAVAISIVVVIFLIVGVFFNNYYYNSKLQAARNVEITVDFVTETDIEEIVMYADDDTYSSIIANIYGGYYIEFEEILDETSYFKL